VPPGCCLAGHFQGINRWIREEGGDENRPEEQETDEFTSIGRSPASDALGAAAGCGGRWDPSGIGKTEALSRWPKVL